MAGQRSYKDREEQILKECESDINEVHDKKKDLWIALEQLGNNMDTLQAKTESVTMTVANRLSEEKEKSAQVVLMRLREEVEDERKALEIVRANMNHYKDKFSGFDKQFKLGKPDIAMLRRIPPDHRERETKIKHLESQVRKFKGMMRELQDEFDHLEKEYAQRRVRMHEIDQIIFCPVDDSDTSEGREWSIVLETQNTTVPPSLLLLPTIIINIIVVIFIFIKTPSPPSPSREEQVE